MYKFCERQTSRRFDEWSKFRKHLETSETPYEDVVKYFQKLPKVKVYTDPYDRSTWPTAWELIEENQYCPFNIILGICFTLQLTDRFSNIDPTISISIDNVNKTVYYLLYFDDKVYGYSEDGWISALDVPKTVVQIKIYPMAPL
jgi:DNA polymerase elongation subunit (family B)